MCSPADTENRYRYRDFLAGWQGSDKKWLLTEDGQSERSLAMSDDERRMGWRTRTDMADRGNPVNGFSALTVNGNVGAP